jgi:hypothetical protein
LEWNKVKTIIQSYLSDLEVDIYIYEPNSAIQEILKKERVKLTPARAMLLAVLYELVKNGEFVSEFATEKIAYFLQRFGAKDDFRLDFSPNFYGPYSGKVKHVLYYLNGSYIMGYNSKDKKPFEEIGLIMEAEKEVTDYLNLPEYIAYKEIVDKTKKLLKGFYSPFGLELLSTIDYLRIEKQCETIEELSVALRSWSNRKRTLFDNPKFIAVALNNLKTQLG